MARPDGALRSGHGRDRPKKDHHVPAACCGADDDEYDRYCDQHDQHSHEHNQHRNKYGGDRGTKRGYLRQFDQQSNRRDHTLNSTSGITNSSNDIILSQASSSQFGAVTVKR
jgi:hypothetical protein